MKSIALALAAAATLIACTTKTENSHTADSTSQQLCYIYANRDTIEMTITIHDKIVKGDLNYKFFEKDRSLGIINGILSGDTIFAEYKFQSEGTTSVREVAFIKSGKSLTEGYGPMNETGIHFSSHSSLEFKGIELQETECN